MCADPGNTAPLCARCSCDSGDGQLIHLWDGKHYCRACISKASPKLALAAERFPALSERIAVNPGHAVRDELLLWCLMGSVFVGFLCFCAWEGGIAIWDGLLVGALVIFLGVPLRALGAYRKAQRVSGRVDLENGCLTIWNPAYGRASWALHDCRWHIGNVREADTFFFGLNLRREVVILECPLTVLFWRERIKVPCGLSPEMREVWEAFLTLAGIERTGRAWWRFV